jgi:hypothetical protein
LENPGILKQQRKISFYRINAEIADHLRYRQNGRSLVRIFWKYSECSENLKEGQVHPVTAEKAYHLRKRMTLHMSIVLIECSIEMYYTKGAVADLRRFLREERDAKNEWEG